ncbi:MAG TPA: SRPBCC family protein, partial [Solirubrobacteraceae bacterium]|nr:SRPBCC family protein [Solirubrobacteraceae bacterium]
MPQFSDAITTSAPPEEVWKLLYDASRFAEWWEGIETSEVRDGGATIYPDGYPDFPMPQAIEASRDDGGRVRISCLVSDIRFEWRLAEHADGTRI